MATASTFSLGSGLVEIAALTALIGGTTAESLILGSRGAAGLPWAAMSLFGSIFVVKACISASTPSFLRDTIGVRNPRADATVGLSLDLNRKEKGRRAQAEAIGVLVESRFVEEYDEKKKTSGPAAEKFEDVYAFDEYTACPLRSCISVEANQPLRAHVYLRDPHWARVLKKQRRMDGLATLTTLLKIVEIYLLYDLGSRNLVWITGIPWMFFFIASVIIELLGCSREQPQREGTFQEDIVSGTLPTPSSKGEQKKVLLGVPLSARRHPVWRITWVLGSLICAGSLVATYVMLSAEPRKVVYAWLGAQTLWLVARSIYYHFAKETDDLKHFVTPQIIPQLRPYNFNYRLLTLVAALSRYQVLEHPRRPHSYTEDLQDPKVVREILEKSEFQFEKMYELPEKAQVGEQFEIDIVAVIGDTMLSSATWLAGSELTGMDLYDSCIVVLRVGGSLRMIPSARVLSGRVPNFLPKDVEATVPAQFLPRGSSNEGSNLSWFYWVPAGRNSAGQMRWLEYSTEWTVRLGQPMPTIGQRRVSVLSDDDVTNKLKTGELLVSLRHVKEVEDIVQKSTEAARVLSSILTVDL